MAARVSVPFSRTMNREQVTLTGKCVGAAAANPTGLKGIGITSVTRSNTGLYTITLADKYAALLMAKFTVIDSTGTKQYTVTMSAVDVVSAKTINITTASAAFGSAPAVANLATTETLLFELTLSNTTQLPNGN